MKEVEIVRPCYRHSNETVTLRKPVNKHKNMQNRVVEFISKFENQGIKIARVNSTLITKSINLQFFTLILHFVGVHCDVNIFKLTTGAQSIYREVNESHYDHDYNKKNVIQKKIPLSE